MSVLGCHLVEVFYKQKYCITSVQPSPRGAGVFCFVSEGTKGLDQRQRQSQELNQFCLEPELIFCTRQTLVRISRGHMCQFVGVTTCPGRACELSLWGGDDPAVSVLLSPRPTSATSFDCARERGWHHTRHGWMAVALSDGAWEAHSGSERKWAHRSGSRMLKVENSELLSRFAELLVAALCQAGNSLAVRSFSSLPAAG